MPRKKNSKSANKEKGNATETQPAVEEAIPGEKVNEIPTQSRTEKGDLTPTTAQSETSPAGAAEVLELSAEERKFILCRPEGLRLGVYDRSCTVPRSRWGRMRGTMTTTTTIYKVYHRSSLVCCLGSQCPCLGLGDS